MENTVIHNSYIPADNKISGDFEQFKLHSNPPKGYNRVTSTSLPREAKLIAKKLLSGEFGTLTPFEVGNRSFIGRVEPHYHKHGGPAKPWGVHKGVSIFEGTNKAVPIIADNYLEESGLLAKLNKFLTKEMEKFLV